MRVQKKFLLLLLVANLLLGSFGVVQAQFQSFDFSGNSPESYQCFDRLTGENLTDRKTNPLDVFGPDINGNFFCCTSGSADADNNECTGGTKIIAQIRPPALQQIEIWFVRILYAIWALVGSLSFLFLVKLGYDYLISRGDPTKITEIRQRIVSYIIGFALVFLAVPILTTVFRLLGVNNAVECYDVNMPGFQFFYTTLCTDPRGVTGGSIVDADSGCEAVSAGQTITGIECRQFEGVVRGCGGNSFFNATIKCQRQTGDAVPTWCVTTVTNGGGCSSTCKPSDCN